MRLIPPETLRGLYARSDLQGAWRTLVHAGLLVAGALLIHRARGHWWLPAALLLQGLVVVSLPYHAEHHLDPSIPFHRLPDAHRWLRPHLGVVARGYARTLRALWVALPAASDGRR